MIVTERSRRTTADEQALGRQPIISGAESSTTSTGERCRPV
jgi:hypothetical protein